MRKKIFSLPLGNIALEDNFFTDTYEPVLKKYKDYISDIYFTYKTEIFGGDAMSNNLKIENRIILEKVQYIQDKYNIECCPTFNNVFLEITPQMMSDFLKLVSKLSAIGIKQIQVPYQHIMRILKLKQKFPDIKFKNSVLQNVHTLQHVYLAAEAGYEIINIDRNIMRNEKELKKIPKLKENIKEKFGLDIKIVLLANETCLGHCPIMDEHYAYNALSRNSIPYFGNEILSCESCSKWFNDIANVLRIANFLPEKEYYDRLLQYIDIIKLHGRSDMPLLKSSLNIVKDYCEGNKYVDMENSEFKYLYKYADDDDIKTYKKIIKNCYFQCWNCGYCDKIGEKITKRMNDER